MFTITVEQQSEFSHCNRQKKINSDQFRSKDLTLLITITIATYITDILRTFMLELSKYEN